ncbi:MAG: hypothetical protein PHS74_11410 [Lachnospiraceae bacterium]|nr:hypothetical protein [Lachnospiraceae bacterium]
MKAKFQKFYQENKFLSIILIFQFLFLMVLLTKVFGKPQEIHFTENDFIMEPNLGVQIFEDGSIGTIIADDNEHDGYNILQLPITGIESGGYQVIVNYEANKSVANSRHSVTDITGTVSFGSVKNRMSMLASTINLDDGHTIQTGRLWVRISSHLDDLTGTVYFNGNGKLSISSIDLIEQPIWRVMRILGYLSFFFIFDFFIILFWGNGILKMDKKGKMTLIGLIGIILLSSLPIFANFIFKLRGHDLDFHLQRLCALADSLRDGQFPDRMHTSMLNNAGYASPLFYGEIFLYFPAMLYNLMVPLQTCYAIYVLLINMATCLISYFCFKEIAGNNYRIGILASFLYTLSAYRFTNLYVRASMGEYTAMVFLPWVILGFWRVYMAEDEYKFKVKGYLPIILGLTGVVQSHIISCEMIAIFVILFCVAFIKKTFKKNRFITLTKALILTILVNLWFLVPFMESLQMKVLVARTDIINNIQHFGAYLIQVFAIFQPGYGSTLTGMQQEMPLSLGLPLVLGLCAFLYCCIQREEWELAKNNSYKIALVAFIGAILAIAFGTIYWPWDTIKYLNPLAGYFLCDIQFPWRYLTMATIFSVLLVVCVMQIVEQKKGRKIVDMVTLILVTAGILVTGIFYMQFTYEADEAYYCTAEEVGNLEVMGAEYLLEESTVDKLVARTVTPGNELVTISDWYTEKGMTYIKCENKSGSSGTIEVPVFNYDNYKAIDVSTREEMEIQNSSNNQILVVLPTDYAGTVKVYYHPPMHWRVCEVVSLLSIFAIIISYIKERKTIFTKRK